MSAPEQSPSESEPGAELPPRLSFKIGEVAELIGVAPHVLRFWETEFSQIRPQKSRTGHRLYSPKDIQFLRRLRRLVHDRGLTLSGARALLAEGEDAVDSVLNGRPSDAARAVDASNSQIEALETALAKTRARAERAEREARRAKAEADFWRDAAQRAERALRKLLDAVRGVAGRMAETRREPGE